MQFDNIATTGSIEESSSQDYDMSDIEESFNNDNNTTDSIDMVYGTPNRFQNS